MKAVRFHEHGGPEVLRLEEVPDPVIGPGEALVRVRACALNHLDLWQRRGLRRVAIPLPHISGSDVAGIVVDSQGGDLPAGTRVMLQPGVSCGRCLACLSGSDNECPHYEVLGYRNHPGGYAELVKVPVQNLVPIADSVPFVERGGVSADVRDRVAHADHAREPAARRRRPGAGRRQRRRTGGRPDRPPDGARVIATAGTDAKLERARALGADEVINHHKQDIAEEIKRLTNRRGVDVVVEHVGEATWAKSVRSLARGGRLVTCGATTGGEAGVDLRALFSKHLSILGSYMGTKAELLRAAELLFAGRLKPVIDRTFPLAEAAAAQQRLEESGQFGKIVLEV